MADLIRQCFRVGFLGQEDFLLAANFLSEEYAAVMWMAVFPFINVHHHAVIYRTHLITPYDWMYLNLRKVTCAALYLRVLACVEGTSQNLRLYDAL